MSHRIKIIEILLVLLRWTQYLNLIVLLRLNLIFIIRVDKIVQIIDVEIWFFPEAFTGLIRVSFNHYIRIMWWLCLFRVYFDYFYHNSTQFYSFSTLNIKSILLVFIHLNFTDDKPQFILKVIFIIFLINNCRIWFGSVDLMLLMENWINS